VNYLCNSEWHANGASGFFEKLIEEGKGSGPLEFLSTHPGSENRVNDINVKAEELMCAEGDDFINRYQQFKNSLP